MCASSLSRCGGLVALLAAFCAAWPSAAQTNRAEEQVRRLRQQLQQLQQDAATQQQAAQKAQAERAALQDRLDAAETQLKAQAGRLQQQARAAAQVQQDANAQARERSSAEERAAAVQAALDSQRKEAAALRVQMQTSERLRTTLQDTYAQLQARHRVQGDGLATCIERNAQLHALGTELLLRYERKGLGDVLASQEPVLQRGRVALENLVQGYQDKLDAQQLPQPR